MRVANNLQIVIFVLFLSANLFGLSPFSALPFGLSPRGVLAAKPAVAKPATSKNAAKLAAKPATTPSPAFPASLAFGTAPKQLVAGQTAQWTFTVTQKNGQPVRDFALVHEKLLHLIVVSQDLSWFDHLHPVYRGNGVFSLPVSLPRAGKYALYADFTPAGKTQQIVRREVIVGAAAGEVLPPKVALVAERMTNLWLHRTVIAAPEAEPKNAPDSAAGGATYHVELMPVPLRAGQDLKLRFQVNDADFQPVTTLEPYLGTLGHAVLVSADTKNYLHTHALQGSGSVLGGANFTSNGPDVVFHVKFPSAGLYKVWAEFKHRGAIITASYVLDVAAAPLVAHIPGVAPAAPSKTAVPVPDKPVFKASPLKPALFNRLPQNLVFQDWQGRTQRAAQWRGQVPLFVFVDAVCPCVGAYDKRMKALEAKYRQRGLRLVYVFASRHDSRAQVQRVIAKRQYSWTIVHDKQQTLLKLFDAHCTTEAFLFDRDGALRYHGRIDDDTFDASAVRERDLENALNAVLSGRPVARRETRVWACELSRR